MAVPLLCVLAACSSDGGAAKNATPTTTGFVGRRDAPRVTVAGDSITELSRARILAALTDRYRVRVDAHTGYTIARLTPAIREQMATHPDVAVVNLGTNDMNRDNPSWRADLDRMLALLAGVPCVEVFTVYDGHHPPVHANIGTRINERLAAAAATGSVHLVDWNAAVEHDPTMVVADGIHPDLAGQRWIANALRERIRADC